MNLKTKLRNKAKHLEPLLRIGKNGLTAGVITELQRQLKKKKIIKVKFLKSFIENRDKKDIACQISKKTNAQIIDLVGNVLVLYKTPSIENNLNKKSSHNKKR